MAAPLSGIGQQQVPLSQPFQPGGSDQTREVRQQDQKPRETEIQARGAASAQTQETNNADNTNTSQADARFANTLENQDGAGGRGNVVDIVV